MRPNLRPAPLKPLRPASPRCRGGVSSVLRLGPPTTSSLAGWLGRAAELAPARAAAAAPAEFSSGIITRLVPSPQLARR